MRKIKKKSQLVSKKGKRGRPKGSTNKIAPSYLEEQSALLGFLRDFKNDISSIANNLESLSERSSKNSTTIRILSEDVSNKIQSLEETIKGELAIFDQDFNLRIKELEDYINTKLYSILSKLIDDKLKQETK